MKHSALERRRNGFSLTELVIVMVVIAILAALTIVSYLSITNGANKQSVNGEVATMASSLKKLKAENGSYPQDITGLETNTEYTYDYHRSSAAYFCISVAKKGYTARVTSGALDPKEGACTDVCPTGYIRVPGDSRFGTSDFCVMKYEAKILGSDNGTQAYSSALVPDSRASGTPWTNLTQLDAKSESQTACTGCHLITDPEWMTIAANVLSVNSNWSGGTVGSGFIYQGHVNNSPGSGLAASSDDTNGMIGYTGNTGGAGLNNRRTLTLTNGEVIWDFSGNVHDFADATVEAGQLPGLVGEVAFAFKEWTNPSLSFRGLAALSRPSAISPTVASYTSAQGVGTLYSNYSDASTRVMMRGGSWGSGAYAGVLYIVLNSTTADIGSSVGFRAAR